ncbi:MAG: glycosyltransferase, partial [Nitrospira sp.]|nr:glycosyltransferase [Nitrospira sp.]
MRQENIQTKIDVIAEYIKKAFPDIIWIQNSTNLGYAKAINQGVELSRGDFLFLLNNDIKPESCMKMSFPCKRESRKTDEILDSCSLLTTCRDKFRRNDGL